MGGHYLKPGCGPSFSEKIFTWRIFGDMFLKFFAPERLKRSTGPVQGVKLCKIHMFTTQIAPFYLVSCDTGIFTHTKNLQLSYKKIKIQFSLPDVRQHLFQKFFM